MIATRPSAVRWSGSSSRALGHHPHGLPDPRPILRILRPRMAGRPLGLHALKKFSSMKSML